MFNLFRCFSLRFSITKTFTDKVCCIDISTLNLGMPSASGFFHSGVISRVYPVPWRQALATVLYLISLFRELSMSWIGVLSPLHFVSPSIIFVCLGLFPLSFLLLSYIPIHLLPWRVLLVWIVSLSFVTACLSSSASFGILWSLRWPWYL